ncbi:MAG: MATE family efflux transporter [Spirochaetales bacterium]
MENDFVRSDHVLKRKLIQYLLPTLASNAALSLTDFLDSMVVSNLLGSKALAIINLGTPLMLIYASVYCLLGNGAATVYAVFLGKRDHESAGKSMTAAITMALTVGLTIGLLGFVFFRPVASILCRDAELLPMFLPYLRVILLSAPFLTTILTFTTLLPSAGYPGYSMVVTIVANIINFTMNIVFIRVFNMGVAGAAWATLAGYLGGLTILVFLALRKKIKLYVSSKIGASLKMLKTVVKQGGPEAMTQVGFALQFAFCNGVASKLAGTAGVVAISLCLQANSLESIFLGSIMGSSIPIMSLLHGQRDYKGQSSVLNTAMKWQISLAAVLSAIFVIFAPQVAALFNITDSVEVAVTVRALRIYCLMLFLRSGIILYFRYLKVAGFSGYAIMLSALDSFILIVPIQWTMSRLFGITGLWWAFPTTALVLLTFILIRNRYIVSHSDGHYKGLLLYENDESSTPVMDVTIMDNADSISGISEKMQAICEQNGVEKKNALLAALAVEEMAVYITKKKDHNAYMDIMVRLYKGNVVIDFRSLGKPFNPLLDTEEDNWENVDVLRGIATEIVNEYTLGMNSTRIVI